MNKQKDYEGIKRFWPEYDIVKELGAGGFGNVYEIRRTYLGNTLSSAVKIIHIPRDQYAANELRAMGMTEVRIKDYYKTQVNAFLNENLVMEKLKSASNIVTIEDSKVEQDWDTGGYTIYIKMELLTSMDQLLMNHMLDAGDIATIANDICSALIACEQMNIIHRDIKPANIFISDFGTFKLGDFGIARQMQHERTSMTQIGTSQYMAPELYAGLKADKRVDIYSLGIMLYRLANYGCFPFVTPSEVSPEKNQEALAIRLSGAEIPLPPQVDEELGKIIVKACAKDPNQRYQSAKEFKQAINRWQVMQAYQHEQNVNKEKKAEVKIEPKQEIIAEVKQETRTAAQPASKADLKQEPKIEPKQEPKQELPVEKVKKKPATIRMTPIVVAVLIIGIVGAFFLGRGEKSPDSTDEDQTKIERNDGNEVAEDETQAEISEDTEAPVISGLSSEIEVKCGTKFNVKSYVEKNISISDNMTEEVTEYDIECSDDAYDQETGELFTGEGKELIATVTASDEANNTGEFNIKFNIEPIHVTKGNSHPVIYSGEYGVISLKSFKVGTTVGYSGYQFHFEMENTSDKILKVFLRSPVYLDGMEVDVKYGKNITIFPGETSIVESYIPMENIPYEYREYDYIDGYVEFSYVGEDSLYYIETVFDIHAAQGF